MRAKALFIFPTEFTADLKKFSLEEKNRKKSYKQPHSQRDKLKLFQKYLGEFGALWTVGVKWTPSLNPIFLEIYH